MLIYNHKNKNIHSVDGECKIKEEHDMSELLKNQKFGVEVEFTGITREMAANAVKEVVGGTISGPRSDGYHTRVIKDSHRRQWKVMRDSSITPKMNVGSASPD